MSTGQTQNTWWTRRWQSWLHQLGLDGSDSGGLRSTRVKRLEVADGLIHAQVQDRELGPCVVEVRLPVLSEAQWEQIIELLASQALFVAQLFAGNMPAEIEQVFVSAGAELLPPQRAVLAQTCSACPPGSTVCRPLAAVYAQLGEVLAEDPWLLLRWRGRDRQQILAAVNERRATSAASTARPRPAEPAAPAHADTIFYTPLAAGVAAPADDTAEDPLDLRIGDFWGRRRVLEDARLHLARPAAELALLRRLGPPTPTTEGSEAYSQFQDIYRLASDSAWALAFAPGQEAEANAANGE